MSRHYTAQGRKRPKRSKPTKTRLQQVDCIPLAFPWVPCRYEADTKVYTNSWPAMLRDPFYHFGHWNAHQHPQQHTAHSAAAIEENFQHRTSCANTLLPSQFHGWSGGGGSGGAQASTRKRWEKQQSNSSLASALLQTLQAYGTTTESAKAYTWNKRQKTTATAAHSDDASLAPTLISALNKAHDQSDQQVALLVTNLLQQHQGGSMQQKQTFYHNKHTPSEHFETKPTTNQTTQQNKWEPNTEYQGDWTYPTNNRNQWSRRLGVQFYQKNYTQNDAKTRWSRTKKAPAVVSLANNEWSLPPKLAKLTEVIQQIQQSRELTGSITEVTTEQEAQEIITRHTSFECPHSLTLLYTGSAQKKLGTLMTVAKVTRLHQQQKIILLGG